MGRNQFSKELREMTAEQIQGIVSDKKMNIMRMRNENRSRDMKITAEWINTKRDIARCMNVLGEKKRQEIREECEREGKPLPRILTKKEPRTKRVSMPKEMIKRFAQNKNRIRRKIVVFTP